MSKTNQSKDNYIYRYYQQISNGSVSVGQYIKMVYEFVIKGLEDKLFYFDQKKADDAINWMESHCFHVEGPLAPNPLKFEVWQKALISCIFGLVDENGNRQFREIVLVVARKNGKSLLASGIAKYIWLVDGGYGARVYCLAPKLDQAEIIYSDVWQQVLLDPEWQQKRDDLDADKKAKVRTDDPELARHRMTDLYLPSTNSTCKKIAFSAKKSDGFNPSLTICDEIASWQGQNGLKQYEVMKSGMGARPEGLMLSCTTSGYENDGIYDELIKRATSFLKGGSKETRLLPFIYMVDDPEKWNDINELRKSNPNLGVSVTVDYLLEEIAIAEGSLSKKAEFLTKYCNVKQNSSQAWLESKDIEKAFSGEELHLEDFKNCYAVAGVDLSQTTDLTACTLLIQKGNKIYGFAKFFMPAERLEKAIAEDNLPYNAYIQRGFLQLSGENFIDYRDCYKWFTDLIEEYKIYPLKIGYDRYSSTYLIDDLKSYGFNCDDVFQGTNLSSTIKTTEGLLKDGVFEFGNNDLLKIHLYNSALKRETETNRVRLIKLAQRSRIDGCAALLDAMCVRDKYNAEIGTQLLNSRR